MASFFAREAKSRIVSFVSKHDDDTLALVAELSQAATNQLAANLAALMLGQNGHRSQ
jgi:hypothetical protein